MRSLTSRQARPPTVRRLNAGSRDITFARTKHVVCGEGSRRRRRLPSWAPRPISPHRRRPTLTAPWSPARCWSCRCAQRRLRRRRGSGPPALGARRDRACCWLARRRGDSDRAPPPGAAGRRRRDARRADHRRTGPGVQVLGATAAHAGLRDPRSAGPWLGTSPCQPAATLPAPDGHEPLSIWPGEGGVVRLPAGRAAAVTRSSTPWRRHGTDDSDLREEMCAMGPASGRGCRRPADQIERLLIGSA